MTKSLVIASQGFGVGAQSVLTFFALMYDKPAWVVAWCAVFVVYHAIVLRRVLREGVQA